MADESAGNRIMGDRLGYEQEHVNFSPTIFKCSSRNELQENLLIHLKLHSSTWGFSIKDKDFSLPMKVMVDRENQYSIDGKSSASYILRKVKEHYHSDIVPSEFLNQTLLDDWYSFHCELTVLIDLDDVVPSLDVVDWHNYLVHDIRKYYVTGKISVFEQGLKEGYDVLYAFKCLDIPFDDRAVMYDSFATVLRSENRLAYYYHREDIARWIAKRLKCVGSSKGKRTVAFLTSPTPMMHDCQIYIDEGDLKCEILSMTVASGFTHVHERQAVVHNLLNEDHIDTDPNYAFLLRTKFASFLENYLPHTKVSFRARKVIFIRDDPTKSFSSILPVLTVEKFMHDFTDSPDSNSESTADPTSWLSMFNLHNILTIDGFPCACSDEYYEEETATTTSTETSDNSLESRTQDIEQVNVISTKRKRSSSMATVRRRESYRTVDSMTAKCTKRKRSSSMATVRRRESNSTADSMTSKWLVNVCFG